MDIGAVLKTFIFIFASSLLYPVLFFLVLMSLWVLLQAGSCFAEWLERSRLEKNRPEDIPEKIRKQEGHGFFPHRVRGYVARLLSIPNPAGKSALAVENLLQQTVHETWKSMDRLRILVRVAPGLGLMGTLIPMGTGLAALGQGDMTRLSADLVIAFTTTVVGLGIGMAAFFLFTIKRRWVEQDVKNMELATEVIAGENPENGAP